MKALKLAAISLFLVTYVWTITIAWAKATGFTLFLSFLPVLGMTYWGYQEWKVNGFTFYVILVIISLIIDGILEEAMRADA